MEDQVKEQIFNNMTKDLHEKLEESPAALAVLNTLPFQKWLNAISKMDIKMARVVKCSAKCVTLELEKEEKKRSLTGLSCAANTSVNASTNSDKHPALYVLNRYNRSCGTLPSLTVLYKHRGCFGYIR